jgi:hypothetical protein
MTAGMANEIGDPHSFYSCLSRKSQPMTANRMGGPQIDNSSSLREVQSIRLGFQSGLQNRLRSVGFVRRGM